MLAEAVADDDNGEFKDWVIWLELALVALLLELDNDEENVELLLGEFIVEDFLLPNKLYQ